MLVLSRLPDEEIVISGPARIRVLEIMRGRVRLGITADRSTRVDRGEIDASRPIGKRCPIPPVPYLGGAALDRTRMDSPPS